MFTLLFLGDIVGRPGREVVSSVLPEIVKDKTPDLIIANGDNLAGGLGIDIKTAEEIFSLGVDIITNGNHIWKKKEIFKYLDKNKDKIVRPINYPIGAPGVGYLKWKTSLGVSIGIVNAMGRIYTEENLDCPFRLVREVFDGELKGCDIKFLDFHAEATSEKIALAKFLDGEVSAVVGTHTHVQTADEQILPGGTAYITDVGMCGPNTGVIGMRADLIIERFLTSLPNKFELAKGETIFNAVSIVFDDEFNAVKIERIVEKR